MASFTFEEQPVIIRFLHLRGMKLIEIHRRLSDDNTVLVYNNFYSG